MKHTQQQLIAMAEDGYPVGYNNPNPIVICDYHITNIYGIEHTSDRGKTYPLVCVVYYDTTDATRASKSKTCPIFTEQRDLLLQLRENQTYRVIKQKQDNLWLWLMADIVSPIEDDIDVVEDLDEHTKAFFDLYEGCE